MSLKKKLLLSALTTASFFLLLELALAIVGFRPLANTEDPFVGFSGYAPLLEHSKAEDGTPILITAQNKRKWFNVQSFPAKKPTGTKRVFCMGGSTTYGHPFFDSTSFAGWMREFLPVNDSSCQWEVINAGGISYASYRVASLMEELSQYEPDLFIVYSVHNEFLERRTYQNMFDRSKLSMYSQGILSRTRIWAITKRVIDRFQKTRSNESNPEKESTLITSDSKRQPPKDVLKEEVDEMLNHTIGPVDYHRDPQWRAKVIKHYESNLKRMVAIAKNANAKIVFVAPASNEKNCSPFKSEHDSLLSRPEQERLQAIITQASSDPMSTDPSVAIGYLKSALEVSPNYADYHYRLGQLQFAMQHHDEAQRSFARAIDEDICPLRAVEEIRHCIDRVGLDTGTPIVDFEKKIRQLCESENGHTILGEEYFLDHVHPTIDINRRLAIWIIEGLQSAGIVKGRSTEDAHVNEEYAALEKRVLGRVDSEVNGYALRNLAKVLHWAGKYDEAEPRARDALLMLPDDAESRFVLADCLKNTARKEEAIAEYEKLFSSGLVYPRASEAYGRLLAMEGRFEQSKAYLLMSIAENDKSAAAYHWLGWVHFQLEEFDFAAESFEQADRRHPNHSETLFFWARTHGALGRHSEAIALFQRVLALGVHEAEVHYFFGLEWMKDKQWKKAIEQFEAALQLAPDWEEARHQKSLAENDGTAGKQ